MCSYGGYQGISNVTPSAIPWQGRMAPKWKNFKACALNEKPMGELNKMEDIYYLVIILEY